MHFVLVRNIIMDAAVLKYNTQVGIKSLSTSYEQVQAPLQMGLISSQSNPIPTPQDKMNHFTNPHN